MIDLQFFLPFSKLLLDFAIGYGGDEYIEAIGTEFMTQL